MFIEFSIRNYRSFGEIENLNLQAARIKSRYEYVDRQNIVEVSEKLSLLKSKAIYGANASGKSNLIRAVVSMLHIIRDSVKDESTLSSRIEPFELCEDYLNQPSFFQVVFIHDGVRYRYGFEASEEAIHSEWLFGVPQKQEVYYFKREGMEVQVNKNRFREGIRLLDLSDDDGFPLYRKDALFLTVAATFNGPVSKSLMDYLENKISVISGLDDPHGYEAAMRAMSEEKLRKKIVEVMRAADFDIEDLEWKETLHQKASEETAKNSLEVETSLIQVVKKKYNSDGSAIVGKRMLFWNQEGEGVKKMFVLSPFLIKALDNGGAFFVDEFDARLHPRLSRKIVELFHSQRSNPNGAQLIFAAHDTNFMDTHLLRRDQICLVEKDQYGASHLHSLVEYKGVRNDASFEKDYLKGKYNAVPLLSKLEEPFVEYRKRTETKPPPSLSPVLFWDTDPEKIRWEEKAAYVISRAVMYGTKEDWNAIKIYYGLERIKEEMVKVRYLDPKSLHFLSLILETPKEKFRCYSLMQSQPTPWNS